MGCFAGENEAVAPEMLAGERPRWRRVKVWEDIEICFLVLYCFWVLLSLFFCFCFCLWCCFASQRGKGREKKRGGFYKRREKEGGRHGGKRTETTPQEIPR